MPRNTKAMCSYQHLRRQTWKWILVAILCIGQPVKADLETIRAQGVLRHLGVPYANFVTGAGDGMDVELMRRFAAHLGVDYRYVKTDWATAIGDLIGYTVRYRDERAEIQEEVPIRGDVIANGMTVIPWREQVVRFGRPTFPTQVWLIAGAELDLKPILPANDTARDILATKAMLHERSLLGKANTCLDPSLYGLANARARIALFEGSLNELAPAVLNGESELTLLDVPDALVALQKWPGRIKVMGPISDEQAMAPAFRPEDTALRTAFNDFLDTLKQSGEYRRLMLKYYPFVFDYFPDFLESGSASR